MAIDKDIWKKSYMLEFVYSGNPPKTEVFTFAVPPESEDFDFSHRLIETKTFGGSIFDSYGNDTVKINLTGSTINNEKKKIYVGAGRDEQLTGEEEIWKLQKLISDANDIKNDVTIYLYDLSKITPEKAGNKGGATKNYWKIKIKDFRIKRDKSKPFSYNYTLDIVSANEARADTNGSVLSLLEDGNVETKSVFFYDTVPQNPALATFSRTFQVGRQVEGIFVSSMEGIQSYANEVAEGISTAVNTASETVEETAGWYDQFRSITSTICDALNVVISPTREFINNAINFIDDTIGEIFTAYDVFSSGDAEQISRYIAGSIDTGLRLLGVSETNDFMEWTDSILQNVDDVMYIISIGDAARNLSIKDFNFENMRYYSVTFDSVGGSLYQTTRVAFGTKVSKPDDPIKEHYDFAGWYSDPEYSEEFDFDEPLSFETLEITLYAKWNTAEVPVTLYGNGGISPVPVVYVAVGGVLTLPEQKPVRSGYIFSRWYRDRECSVVFNENTPITQELILYAGWDPAVTVTFDSADGSPVDAQYVRKNGKAVYPLVPTRKNYALVAWYSDAELHTVFDFSTVIDRNLTLYAGWELVTATVIFIPNGGSEVQPQTVKIGKKATLPECTKTGSQIDSWCTDPDLAQPYNFNAAVDEDLTLYAKWNTAAYTVTYDSMGGSVIQPGTVRHGDCIIYPDIPSKPNCIFLYWQTRTETEESETDGPAYVYEEYDFSTPAAGNITLYAAWFDKMQ